MATKKKTPPKKKTAVRKRTSAPRARRAASFAVMGAPEAAVESIALDLSAVTRGQAAARATAKQITSELPNILDLFDRNDLALRRDRAEILADDLEQVRIDLVAAGTVISLLSAAEVSELTKLEKDLEDSIVRSRLINLTLDNVALVLEGAVRVRDIIKPRV